MSKKAVLELKLSGSVASVPTCPPASAMPPPGDDYVATATAAFQAANSVPLLKRANIASSGFGGADHFAVNTVWSQDSPAAGKKVATARVYTWNPEKKSIVSIGNPIMSADKPTMRETRGDLRVVVSREKGEGSKDQDVIYVFRKDALTETYNLSDVDEHGPVYFDGEFGGIAVSQDLSTVAYIAEKKEPKQEPFCKTKNGAKKEESGKKDEASVVVGEKFAFKDTFGEQLEGKSRPCIVLLNLNDHSFRVLDNEALFGSPNYHPGQLSFFGSSTLVGIAIKSEAYYLGIIYCSNRPCPLFTIDLGGGTAMDVDGGSTLKAEFLRGDDLSCKSPRVNDHNGLLVWLERDLTTQSGLVPGPHQTSYRLMKANLKGDRKPEVVVSDEADQTRTLHCAEHEKHILKGIFTFGEWLPRRCFLSDSKVVFTSVISETEFAVIVDLAAGDCETNVFVQSKPSVVVHDCVEGIIVGSFSTPIEAPRLFVGVLGKDNYIHFYFAEDAPSDRGDLLCETLWITPTASHPDPHYSNVNFSAIFVGPNNGAESSCPVILWPHGGPHSVIVKTFMVPIDYFTRLGYGIVFVNFRGSLGETKKAVESLPGHIGNLDVKDCRQALDEALKKYPQLDGSRVFLLGGSHGGFLVLHLAGQYPGDFRGVVARNPVVNSATMATVTDIPDWNMVEVGSPFDYNVPNPRIASHSQSMSPIHYVDKVKAPVFLMLGSKDLRVPHSQGIEYYRALKSKGKSVRMNVYEDNHPLAKVPVTTDVFINAALFFHENSK